MLRAMIFIDHQNFTLSLRSYYKDKGKVSPKLDYKKFPNNIVKYISKFYNKAVLLKTFLFAPKPDDFLMTGEFYSKFYNWVTGIGNLPYVDLVEGRWVSRSTKKHINGKDNESGKYINVPKNINDDSTYYVVEKGTDLNLAVHALSKAYNNSYDIAVIMSADTDYISLYRQLRSMGKIVVVALIEDQNKKFIQPEVDEVIMLDENFFKSCIKYDVNT